MIARSAAVGALRLYKRFISPVLPPACRFTPTCSEYAAEAIEKHGILRGGTMAMHRASRRTASVPPRSIPCFWIASAAYSEQVGAKRQAGGRTGEMKRL